METTLKRIGSKKFFSSTDENVKKDRESFALMYFMVAMKKVTGLDWFLLPVKDQFPDFSLLVFDGNPPGIGFAQIELVEVPPRCTSIEEARVIIKGKLENHYSTTNYDLLIYLNNAQSPTWVEQLKESLLSPGPFRRVWVLRLEGSSTNTEITGCVVNRLFHQPIETIRVDMNDPAVYRRQSLPAYIEEEVINGVPYIRVKPEVMKELLFEMRKETLTRSRTQRIDRDSEK